MEPKVNGPKLATGILQTKKEAMLNLAAFQAKYFAKAETEHTSAAAETKHDDSRYKCLMVLFNNYTLIL